MHKKRNGPFFVGMLLLAGALVTGLTWWNYTRSNFSTSDAVLFLGGETRAAAPPSPSAPAEAGPESADFDREIQAVEKEIRIYEESLKSAREAIEDAVVMVQEQNENFEFARERYETLMPLVETGALEPLAASQIQSAYISARASLSQAKFFLSQARRDFGSTESRVWRYRALQQRLETLKKARGEMDDATGFVGNGETERDSTNELEATHAQPHIIAYFKKEGAPEPIQEGMQARVTFAYGGGLRFPATVESVESFQDPSGSTMVYTRVVLAPGKLPEFTPERVAVPCQVTIDGSLPQLSPPPKETPTPEPEEMQQPS